MTLPEKILEYIEANSGMPASISLLRSELGLDTTYSTVHRAVRKLKNRGVIREHMGRWYID
jgi:DNA-binding Lrp family transcriptional regulator